MRPAYPPTTPAAGYVPQPDGAGRPLCFHEPDDTPKAAPDYSNQTFDVELLVGALAEVLLKTERKAPPPKTSFVGIGGHEQESSA